MILNNFVYIALVGAKHASDDGSLSLPTTKDDVKYPQKKLLPVNCRYLFTASNGKEAVKSSNCLS